MKRNTRRFLSLALSMIMIASLFTMPAAASREFMPELDYEVVTNRDGVTYLPPCDHKTETDETMMEHLLERLAPLRGDKADFRFIPGAGVITFDSISQDVELITSAASNCPACGWGSLTYLGYYDSATTEYMHPDCMNKIVGCRDQEITLRTTYDYECSHCRRIVSQTLITFRGRLCPRS